MKRYLLFRYDAYYPLGGFNDFSGSFDTIVECQLAHHNGGKADYYQVVDMTTGEVVEEG